jgi:hypothetical protein
MEGTMPRFRRRKSTLTHLREAAEREATVYPVTCALAGERDRPKSPPLMGRSFRRLTGFVLTLTFAGTAYLTGHETSGLAILLVSLLYAWMRPGQSAGLKSKVSALPGGSIDFLDSRKKEIKSLQQRCHEFNLRLDAFQKGHALFGNTRTYREETLIDGYLKLVGWQIEELRTKSEGFDARLDALINGYRIYVNVPSAAKPADDPKYRHVPLRDIEDIVERFFESTRRCLGGLRKEETGPDEDTYRLAMDQLRKEHAMLSEEAGMFRNEFGEVRRLERERQELVEQHSALGEIRSANMTEGPGLGYRRTIDAGTHIAEANVMRRLDERKIELRVPARFLEEK